MSSEGSYRADVREIDAEQDASSDGFAGVQLIPARTQEFGPRELPAGCEDDRVRVEVNRGGGQLTVRVRTPRTAWTVEVERETARISSRGQYRPMIPTWVAVLLNDLELDPTMDWRELTG